MKLDMHYTMKRHIRQSVNYIYGLGGRDTNPIAFRGIFEDLLQMAKTGHVENQINYFGLRE